MAAEVNALLDLGPELLLVCVTALSAADQARARAVCKLLHIIVEEIARTTSYMISGVAPLPALQRPPMDMELNDAAREAGVQQEVAYG